MNFLWILLNQVHVPHNSNTPHTTGPHPAPTPSCTSASAGSHVHVQRPPSVPVVMTSSGLSDEDGRRRRWTAKRRGASGESMNPPAAGQNNAGEFWSVQLVTTLSLSWSEDEQQECVRPQCFLLSRKHQKALALLSLSWFMTFSGLERFCP